MMQRFVMKAHQHRMLVGATKRNFAKLVNYETAQPAPVGSASDCKFIFK